MIQGHFCVLRVGEADKSEATWLSIVVLHHACTYDLTIWLEQLHKVAVVKLRFWSIFSTVTLSAIFLARKVLNIEVRRADRFLTLLDPLSLSLKTAHVERKGLLNLVTRRLLARWRSRSGNFDHFAVHLRDSSCSGFSWWELNETIASWFEVCIDRNFSRCNLSKLRELLMKIPMSPPFRATLHKDLIWLFRVPLWTCWQSAHKAAVEVVRHGPTNLPLDLRETMLA